MKRIMVVDDEPDQLYTIKITLELENNDFEIISVKNGKECIDKLRKNEIPDLILLDIMMPEMNGWEVLEIIRGNNKWKDIPIIFLTAKTDELADKYRNLVADDYIEKPFDIHNLSKRIKRILD